MSVRFDPRAKLILVRAALSGPLGRMNVRLALDTGATRTTVDPSRLAAIGIEAESGATTQQVTTASGIETVASLSVPHIRSLGLERENLMVLAHRLPPGAAFDGMLGLDMFRGRRLTIDFRSGMIGVD